MKEIGVEDSDLRIIAKSMAQWYGTYEELCENDVLKKVRERITKDKNMALLISY